jgi:uncharacterized membrane protein (UPF0127 family)
MVAAFLVILVAGVSMIISLKDRRIPVSIGDAISYAQVADTDSSREKGLSGSKPLAENESMLFVFDVPSRWGMWMKDMHYSLDIVWLDSSKKIVHTEQHIAPDTYPKAFLPQKDAQYVVELPAGYIQRHSVMVGQTVTFAGH